jgi:hypothetical protein
MTTPRSPIAPATVAPADPAHAHPSSIAPAATPRPALAAGYRATTCPRCGGPFACGVGADPSTPCFCVSIALDAKQLAELRERYADCLCAACLAAIASAGDSAMNRTEMPR